MRQRFAIFVASACFAAELFAGGERLGDSVNLGEPIDPSQSAGLFVGVREFKYDDTLTEVKYAVDDAVDLAYLLSIERTPQLLDPARVVLALSGKPQKDESKRRLKQLLSAGAVVKPAGHADVVTLLDQQVNAIRMKGVLFVSFATHGLSEKGTQYLLTQDSVLRHGAVLTENAVTGVVSKAKVPRALILLDACRKQLTTDTRAGDADPRSAAGMLKALAAVNGIVVFSAAASGDYAYDDDRRRNGVFTAEVIEGLRCKAGRDARGYVTVDTLWSYVERQVLSWVQKNRDRGARRATQIQVEGKAKTMPLSLCAAVQ